MRIQRAYLFYHLFFLPGKHKVPAAIYPVLPLPGLSAQHIDHCLRILLPGKFPCRKDKRGFTVRKEKVKTRIVRLPHLRLLLPDRIAPLRARFFVGSFIFVQPALRHDPIAGVGQPFQYADGIAAVDISRSGPALYGMDSPCAVEGYRRPLRDRQNIIFIFQQYHPLGRGSPRDPPVMDLISAFLRTGHPWQLPLLHRSVHQISSWQLYFLQSQNRCLRDKISIVWLSSTPTGSNCLYKSIIQKKQAINKKMYWFCIRLFYE